MSEIGSYIVALKEEDGKKSVATPLLRLNFPRQFFLIRSHFKGNLWRKFENSIVLNVLPAEEF